jgi:hypothetical protein
MQIIEKEMIQSDKIVAIYCNCCGKKIEPKYPEDIWFLQSHPFHVQFEYGSPYDTEFWHFDLCETCLFKFIDSFAITPKKGFLNDDAVCQCGGKLNEVSPGKWQCEKCE